MAASCSNNNEETGGSSAVGVVTGTYQATITPTMGTKQMAQGPHIVVLEALNNNQQVRFISKSSMLLCSIQMEN